MLSKSYQALFKNPTGLHKTFKRIIIDIDERLKRLENGVALSGVFALVNHVHDDIYARINHKHDDYLLKNESSVNSQHLDNFPASHFSVKGHFHKDCLYIKTFVIKNVNTGSVSVNLPFDVSRQNVLVLEDIGLISFHIDNVVNNCVNLSYEFNKPSTVTRYHLLYWTHKNIESGELEDVSINTHDINATQGETITLYSESVDADGNPISKGNVEYEVYD